MDILSLAIEISALWHRGQTDEAGIPYILHPLRVMQCLAYLRDDELLAIAVMHDLIKDTPITLSDLSKYGFSERVVNAIEALTRRDGEDYDKYIDRVATNTDAIQVKIEDLEDNSDLSRINLFEQKDIDRYRKYFAAKKKLMNKVWSLKQDHTN